MPRYKYKCKACDVVIEKTCTIQERPDSVQCKCGQDAAQTVTKVGLVAGKMHLPKSKRQLMRDRLRSREERLTGMEKSGPGGREQANKFRELSKKVTNGRF